MIFGGGLLGLAVLGLWVFCVLDVIRTDASLCENLPKPLWLFIVIFVPTVGSIAWLVLGRPTGMSFRFTQPQQRQPRLGRAVSDPVMPPGDPDYHRKREEALERYNAEREAQRLAAWEAELREREEELRRRKGGES